ncbi:peptide deformylase, mitochondrial-like isoform X2 [Anoplophora glabripennis]|uniref:peptide deformylase, mitochondrial-like isoform X2 n=1 Tax=Anoplophora glabripennis TaxID=217634 RepID=UPI0008752FC1|nr:peptide deformylase, mitochondrial-like isoform X2 [Anoplophora glabripennis]
MTLNFNQSRFISYKQVRTWYANLVKPRKNEAPYRHIIQIGDPTLRATSEKVPTHLITSPEIKSVIDQMKLVFNKYKCVGLSAAQIGIPIQIFLMEFNKNHAKLFNKQEQKNMEMLHYPLKVVINPEIKILDYTKIIFPEACESIKGFYADVARYRSLNLKDNNNFRI